MKKLALLLLLLPLVAHAQAMAPSKCVSQDFDFVFTQGICKASCIVSTNLVLYSAGNGAAWTPDGLTATGGAADPLSGTTGTTLATVAGTAAHRIYQATTFPGGAETLSFYAQYVGGGAQFVGMGSDSNTGIRAVFDIQNHVFDSTDSTANITSTTVTAAGNGFYRYTASIAASPGASYIALTLGETTGAQAFANSYTAVGAKSALVTFEQLEQRASATPYIATTTAAASRTCP